jgi:hypothetical protein
MINSKYLILTTNPTLKNIFEWIFIIFLFIFSFFNNITLLISLFLLLFFLSQKEIGALKIINIIAFRTIINQGISTNISNWQYIKFIILIGCSIYLIFTYRKLDKYDLNKLKIILLFILLFSFYNILVALFFSSLPIIAISKLLGYVIVFLGVLIGVGYTYRKFNWIKWMLVMMQLIIIFSIFTINMPVAYFSNGRSFQGLLNQPNMFGIFSVLFVAFLFSYSSIHKNNKVYSLFLIFITFYMITLCESRTSLASVIILLILYILFANIKITFKAILINLIIVLILIISLFEVNIYNFIVSFFYKGHENILYSRTNQIERITSNFLNNPFFGNGFGVPVLPYKSYNFSFEFVVEPGNLILSVLSYSGIIGFIIFLAYIVKIFWINHQNFKKIGFLFIAPILVSMGEMVFFSSNSIGALLYTMIGIYIFENGPNKNYVGKN